MMDTIVFGTYTVKALLPYAIGLVALWIVWKIAKAFFKTEKTYDHMQIARCKGCGWSGQISRYAGRCPNCNEPLGDRKLRVVK